jgi:hypothetical protein
MKTRSRKTKGKRGQNKARLALVEFFKEFGLKDGDFLGVPAGIPGTDVVLSPKAQRLFNYDVEVKNHERLNIWDAIIQSRNRLIGDLKSIIFFTRNREKMYVTLEMEDFFNIYRAYVKELLLNPEQPVLPKQIQEIPTEKENS